MDDGEPTESTDARRAGGPISPRRTRNGHSAVIGDRNPPSTAVVEATAAAAGVSPADLDPLYRSIDPEALDSLCASRAPDPERIGDLEVAFSYEGYRITVSKRGYVVVEERAERG